MITQDDIDAMANDTQGEVKPKAMPREFYLSDPIYNRMQWEIRRAFELGFSANGPRGQSIVDPKKGAWFDAWLMSPSRQFLIANNMMTGDEGYK